MSFYEVRVVTRDGTVLATFEGGDGDQDVSVLEVNDVLNEPGMARVRVPVHHPAAVEMVALKREVQVFRDGVLIHWGPLVQRDYADGAVTWTVPGVLWYLSRRVFGPITVNHLANPNFESSLSSWTAMGPTATHSTAVRVRGPGTARLVSTSSDDSYLSQAFIVDTGSIGLFLAVAGWYWIDPAVPFEAPAEEFRGLYVAATNSAEGEPQYERIDMSSPVGEWVRVETGIHLLPDLVDEEVEVRLYSPWGAIHWGATSATEEESVSSAPDGTDIAEMMGGIVFYAQHGAGKSDLNIDIDTPAAGVKETVAYQFYDLANIFETLKTYPARGLADFSIVLDAMAGTRTFTTHAPTRGTFKADHPLVVAGEQVLTLSHTLDGQQTATKTIRRGQGEGSDREVGVATDTSALDGLVLEDVADVPPEITVDGLDQYAATDLERLRRIVSIPEVTVPAAGWWGEVFPGDTVPVTIDWGAVQEDTVLRVLVQRLNPASDTVTITLGNPA